MITTPTTLPFNPRCYSKIVYNAFARGDDHWEINWRNCDDGHRLAISKSSVRARWFGTCRLSWIGKITLLCTLVCDLLTRATPKSVISLHVSPPTRFHRHICGHRCDGEGPSLAGAKLIFGHVVNVTTDSAAAAHFEEHGLCILLEKVSEESLTRTHCQAGNPWHRPEANH